MIPLEQHKQPVEEKYATVIGHKFNCETGQYDPIEDYPEDPVIINKEGTITIALQKFFKGKMRFIMNALF